MEEGEFAEACDVIFWPRAFSLSMAFGIISLASCLCCSLREHNTFSRIFMIIWVWNVCVVFLCCLMLLCVESSE